MATNVLIPNPIGAHLRPEWSRLLVVDVALGTSKQSILDAHELQDHQYEEILHNVTFVMEVDALRKQLEKDGATFKLKAQLQVDTYLQQAHEMIVDKDCDPRVRTRLIENMARWAGYDSPQPVGGAGGGIGGFSININFAESSRTGITIEGESQ